MAFELHALIGRLKRRFRAEAYPGDCSPSQVAVLHHLEFKGPATVTTLARVEGVRPQSMGATVSALETAGWVKGVPDPGDGRQTIFSLTGEARRQFQSGRAMREDWLFRTIEDRLTPAEQERLGEAVELLKRIADP